ncbi:MAG TPA: glycosyltransferase family A protein [Terriglobia bacterium]|nr:glycosyltransferase family A protein [Terriglobia bacterium]
MTNDTSSTHTLTIGESVPKAGVATPANTGAGRFPITGLPSYVVITPVRNEAQFIELTLKSMVRQTVKPLKWVIVSDGSTDGTEEIVSRYVDECPWIELVRMPERCDRNFAGKVHAINAALNRVKELDYALIAVMDGDISFEEDYFAYLLSKFPKNPRLGLAGTPYLQGKITYDFRYSNAEDVPGACQLFRRECFEAIGGYLPVKSGGIDLIAALSARAKGWRTRIFTERVCVHHGLRRGFWSPKTGGVQCTTYRARIHLGYKDYQLGCHPVWEIFRCIYQMHCKPFVIGGILMLAAYFWYLLRGVEQTIPKDLIELRQREQIHRLKKMLVRGVSRRLHFD